MSRIDSKGEIVIYKSPEGDTQINVKLTKKTVWLTQSQISSLFNSERSVITKHIRNVCNSGELVKKSVCAKFAHTASDGKTYQTNFYNLDMIISIGYRVNSKRGTQFRIWANKVLKDYLVQGYALNEKRLKEQTGKVKELEKSLEVFKRAADNYQLKQDEFTDITKVISDYTYALDILDQYDHKKLKVNKVEKKEKYKINYEDSVELINNLRKKFGGSSLFGITKDESFRSTLGTIYQTFDKKELYPSLDEKASMLLYLAIKNHSFIDGNKRIGAALFLMFLNKNKYLYKADGEKRIADNALVALCLLVAESNPREKDTIIKVIINLINKNNF